MTIETRNEYRKAPNGDDVIYFTTENGRITHSDASEYVGRSREDVERDGWSTSPLMTLQYAPVEVSWMATRAPRPTPRPKTHISDVQWCEGCGYWQHVSHDCHPAPDCPQCEEPSCDCVPMCPARLAESSVDDDWNHDGASVEYACELPPDHDGYHRDGSVSWCEEE